MTRLTTGTLFQKVQCLSCSRISNK